MSTLSPSRATILRGQYAHNHKVWDNVEPSGGFWSFLNQGHEDSTVATWLNAAGFATILIGKYLNRYGLDRYGNRASTTHVPPGWDYWHAWQGTYSGTDASYRLNENGRLVTYKACQPSTAQVMPARALRDGFPAEAPPCVAKRRSAPS